MGDKLAVLRMACERGLRSHMGGWMLVGVPWGNSGLSTRETRSFFGRIQARCLGLVAAWKRAWTGGLNVRGMSRRDSAGAARAGKKETSTIFLLTLQSCWGGGMVISAWVLLVPCETSPHAGRGL